jgi:RimJ/RimL family protein N-acetyltransferase
LAASGPARSRLTLVPAGEADFLWMLGEGPSDKDLRAPPGGVDDPVVIGIVRRMAAAMPPDFGAGCWLMVVGDEVVGLLSYKRAPDTLGRVEIGYGVAESRRGLGYASAAVAALIELAVDDPRLSALIAETAVDNIASQRVLERGGFERTGERDDPEDGPLILWRRDVVA